MGGQNDAPFKTASDDATRLEIETRQAPGRYRGHLHADAQDGPERFLHRPHAGGVVELYQDAHLVELAVLEHLDLELLDRREASDDSLDRGREYVDAAHDEHVVEAAENSAHQ